MINIENVEVVGWEVAIRSMHNYINSWEKSDSGWFSSEDDMGVDYVQYNSHSDPPELYFIGSNDLNLMKKLAMADSEHCKFMQMITVYLDITAPLYWWEEFDTYKVGIVGNSRSIIHKITNIKKEFTLEDFSYEHLDIRTHKILEEIIKALNDYRTLCINYNADDFEIKGCPSKKDLWWNMIQLIPSSYNQKRTIMLNYEVLANIYKSRKNHKLDEWREFCDWIKTLPYSELITGDTYD